ncbi:hypothetical protein TNCV_503841 [Trichonephila clavipes]|nr:hypothetical protein TNCV_503841 [Trichonephila clavipes]
MQNHFGFVVAGIIIRLLVLITPHAVDFEAGDWNGKCAGRLSVDWIKGGQRLICLRTLVGVSGIGYFPPIETIVTVETSIVP